VALLHRGDDRQAERCDAVPRQLDGHVPDLPGRCGRGKYHRRSAVAAPMSHGAGLYNFVHVLRGSRHIVPASSGFDPQEVLDLGALYGPVSMFAAPTMVRRLTDAARRCGSSGEGRRSTAGDASWM
jgi:acyl-CoA synthetase (AMP-forming)/AMP-acid ligase II